MRMAVALAALVTLAGCAATPPATGDQGAADAIADNFVRLVASPPRSGEPVAKIRKWATPIRYASVGPASPLARASLDLAMNQLASLTGVDIGRAIEDLPNYLVIFNPSTLDAAIARHAGLSQAFFDSASEREGFARQPRTGACALHATTERSNWTIRSALLVVPVSRDPLETGRCITSLTARSMGFLSDVNRLDSAMSDAARVNHLTSEDKLMLRVLYDARLKPGTPASEAAPVVRSVLATLRGN